MDKEKTSAVAEWLRKAKHDLRSAHRLYTDTPPLLDTAVYHCQQAAEKALKGYLILHDIPFRKTHLLVPLVAECARVDPEFDELAEAAATLTPFATDFRYPGEGLDPEQTDVVEAMQLAQIVVDFVLNRLPSDQTGEA
jgi:HEPN domain-containing protein